jgi:hypothetical protein
MTVLDKDVPLAIALAYIYGLQHLISVIGEPLRKRIRGSRRDTTDAEWELVFADEVWVFPRNRTWKQMVWSGMDVWKQALKEIPSLPCGRVTGTSCCSTRPVALLAT